MPTLAKSCYQEDWLLAGSTAFLPYVSFFIHSQWPSQTFLKHSPTFNNNNSCQSSDTPCRTYTNLDSNTVDMICKCSRKFPPKNKIWFTFELHAFSLTEKKAIDFTIQTETNCIYKAGEFYSLDNDTFSGNVRAALSITWLNSNERACAHWGNSTAEGTWWLLLSTLRRHPGLLNSEDIIDVRAHFIQ